MFYSMQELRKSWGVAPKSILHVGAHKAEEALAYEELGVADVTWIEAQSQEVENLRTNLNPKIHKVIHAAVWEISGLEKEFHVTNNSESSSFLELGTHKNKYPHILVTDSIKMLTSTLDDLLQGSKFDFVNLDIQGAELQALRGFKSGLRNVKWIYLEVNSQPLYRGCPLIEDIDEFLIEQGFRRYGQRWWKKDGWGDAIYIQSDIKIPSSIWLAVYRLIKEIVWRTKNWLRIILLV